MAVAEGIDGPEDPTTADAAHPATTAELLRFPPDGFMPRSATREMAVYALMMVTPPLALVTVTPPTSGPRDRDPPALAAAGELRRGAVRRFGNGQLELVGGRRAALGSLALRPEPFRDGVGADRACHRTVLASRTMPVGTHHSVPYCSHSLWTGLPLSPYDGWRCRGRRAGWSARRKLYHLSSRARGDMAWGAAPNSSPTRPRAHTRDGS